MVFGVNTVFFIGVEFNYWGRRECNEYLWGIKKYLIKRLLEQKKKNSVWSSLIKNRPSSQPSQLSLPVYLNRIHLQMKTHPLIY